MIVASCQHESVKRNGKDHKGRQRFRCKLCGHDWIEDTPQPLGDMRISMKQATTALKMLLEGLSMRAVSRITGLDRGTVNNLILTVGENCAALMESIKGVEASDVEADEIWSFLGIREKRRVLRGYSSEAFGDIWTWIGLESNSNWFCPIGSGAAILTRSGHSWNDCETPQRVASNCRPMDSRPIA